MVSFFTFFAEQSEVFCEKRSLLILCHGHRLQKLDKEPIQKDKVPDLSTEEGRKLAARQKRHKAIKTRNLAYGDASVTGWRFVQDYERKRSRRLRPSKARKVKHYSFMFGERYSKIE